MTGNGKGRPLSTIVEHYGWFKGDAFSDWMRKQVYSPCGDAAITFAELEARARHLGSKCKERLVIRVHNLRRGIKFREHDSSVA